MNKILLKIFIIDKALNEENIEIEYDCEKIKILIKELKLENVNKNMNENKNKSMKIYNKEKVELAIKDNSFINSK